MSLGCCIEIDWIQITWQHSQFYRVKTTYLISNRAAPCPFWDPIWPGEHRTFISYHHADLSSPLVISCIVLLLASIQHFQLSIQTEVLLCWRCLLLHVSHFRLWLRWQNDDTMLNFFWTTKNIGFYWWIMIVPEHSWHYCIFQYLADNQECVFYHLNTQRLIEGPQPHQVL
mgnify:CR=1 FL=1